MLHHVTWTLLTLPEVKQMPTWMPGSGFKTNALRVRGIIRQVLDIPYNKVKANMVRAPDDLHVISTDGSAHAHRSLAQLVLPLPLFSLRKVSDMEPSRMTRKTSRVQQVDCMEVCPASFSSTSSRFSDGHVFNSAGTESVRDYEGLILDYRESLTR